MAHLSEKLAKIWHGEAEEEELDAYTEERRRVANEHVLALTHQNRSNISMTDGESRKKQQDEMRNTAANPKAAYRHVLKISMIESMRTER